MKRDEVRRHGRNMSTRAASELPPGPIGVPAWSRLKDRSARSSVTDRIKAGPGAVWTPQMSMRYRPLAYLSAFFDALPASGLLERMWRAERRSPRFPKGSRTPIGLRFSARHPLMPRGLARREDLACLPLPFGEANALS